MSEESVEGGCLCGRVRYAATGRRLWAAYCHCATCRHHVASPVAVFVGYRHGQVRFSGAAAPAIYRSSPDVERGFCAACGTPIFYRSDRHPGEIHLLIGTFDRPAAFAPTRHVFHDEKLPWFDAADHLPRHPGSSLGAPPSRVGPAGVEDGVGS